MTREKIKRTRSRDFDSPVAHDDLKLRPPEESPLPSEEASASDDSIEGCNRETLYFA
jgi:hypothetical protein